MHSSPVHSTFHAHLILLDLIILALFVMGYKLWSSIIAMLVVPGATRAVLADLKSY
jgi:hypothetical protein